MFKLPNLPYNYNSLEPFIDEQTMKLHHDAHHAAYVKNLNNLLSSNQDMFNMDIYELVKNLDKVPEAIRTKVQNNGGQHANHSLFWLIMGEPDKTNPSGNLVSEINKSFMSLDKFKEEFSSLAVTFFGSGWVFLAVENGKLVIKTAPNGDTPLMQGITPVLNLDVWEHAYYLKYQNRRKDYVDAWWHVVNWHEVENQLEKAHS